MSKKRPLKYLILRWVGIGPVEGASRQSDRRRLRAEMKRDGLRGKLRGLHGKQRRLYRQGLMLARRAPLLPR